MYAVISYTYMYIFIHRAFEEYGPISSLWVSSNPPGSASIVFVNSSDAADAVQEMNGCIVSGVQIWVEFDLPHRQRLIDNLYIYILIYKKGSPCTVCQGYDV